MLIRQRLLLPTPTNILIGVPVSGVTPLAASEGEHVDPVIVLTLTLREV